MKLLCGNEGEYLQQNERNQVQSFIESTQLRLAKLFETRDLRK